MKFYEVGPYISLTQHAITVRPICFSGKTFRKLPPDLQAAILKAGKEAGNYGRDIESSADTALLMKLEKEGKLKTFVFTERAEAARARRAREAGVREGNRRDGDPQQGQRDQVAPRPARRGQDARGSPASVARALGADPETLACAR